MDSQVTISEYASRHGVSASTVRRCIKAGALSARLVGGRYFINDEQVDSQMDSHVNSQDDHGTDQVNSQSSQVDQSELVAQLQSEVEYLRDQLDKQTSLLAVTTQQNASLTKQLERPKPAVRSGGVGEDSG